MSNDRLCSTISYRAACGIKDYICSLDREAPVSSITHHAESDGVLIRITPSASSDAENLKTALDQRWSYVNTSIIESHITGCSQLSVVVPSEHTLRIQARESTVTKLFPRMLYRCSLALALFAGVTFFVQLGFELF